MNLIVGPHGSGKTKLLAEVAGRALEQRKRVAYLTLPHARPHGLRRIVGYTGASIGLEAIHFQQLYTRILASAGELASPVNLIGRVALVGRALSELLGTPPSPGEASLFARAIAELKKFGYTPEQIPTGFDPEIDRLQKVYELYERLKNGAQDPDDRRNLATLLVGKNGSVEADLLLVDGFRELSPAEVHFLQAVTNSGVEVHVALPEPLPGHEPSKVLGEPKVKKVHYTHANPVEEAKWTLTRAKQLIVSGADPANIAIITPEPLLPLYRLFATDLGVPLNDESPKPLSETPAGRFLTALLALPDNPDPNVLQQIPELSELAEAVFLAGVSGRDAIHKLAEETGYLNELQNAESRVVPTGDLEGWIENVLSSYPVLAESPWRESLLAAGFEAINLLGEHALRYPEALRTWWAAMISFMRPRSRPVAGVTLVPPGQLAGRRYEHTFVTYAVAGAYQSKTQEDYFFPDAEPFRERWEEAFKRAGLPMRLRDQTVRLWQEVAHSGLEVTISYPIASSGGKLEPEPGLIPVQGGATTKIAPAPVLPPAHPRDTNPPVSVPQLPKNTSTPLSIDDAENLRGYEECGWRQWLRLLKVDGDHEKPKWVVALSNLADAARTGKELSREDLNVLGITINPNWRYEFYPEFVVEGIRARTHALAINDASSTAYILHFTDAPLTDQDSARNKVSRRWDVYLAALYLLQQGYSVHIWVRSLETNNSIEAYSMFPKDLEKERKWPAKTLYEKLRRAKEAKEKASIQPLHYAPNPNTCYRCDYRDICRRPQT